MARADRADNTFYATYGPREIGTPFPVVAGTRRMGIDRERGIILGANSERHARPRRCKTLQTTLIPCPTRLPISPTRRFQTRIRSVDAAVDDRPRSPSTIPRRLVDDVRPRNPGHRVRIPALLERGDNVEVVFAYARSSKIAVLSVRSEARHAAARGPGRSRDGLCSRMERQRNPGTAYQRGNAAAGFR